MKESTEKGGVRLKTKELLLLRSNKPKERARHHCCRHQQAKGTPHLSLPLSQILRFASHHSQLVGLHSPVAMENCSYPNIISWARTQVYPDGIIGVLNSALAVPNIHACRSSVVIGDRILSLKGTTWWRIRDPLLLETTVFCSSLLRKQNDGRGMYSLI